MSIDSKKHMIKYDIKKILYFQKRGRMGPYLVLVCLFLTPNKGIVPLVDLWVEEIPPFY